MNMLLFTPRVISFEQFQPTGADISVDHANAKLEKDKYFCKM